MAPLIDILGNKYHRLKVIKLIDPHKPSKWLCLCDCGNETIVRGNNLKSGTTKSCGCLMRETSAALCRKNRTIHGLSHTPIWNTYRGIKSRCNHKENPAYKHYGGRGIKCEWRSFQEFYKDMGDIPGTGYSIDRINNNGNYSKQNCRWATVLEQMNNRRVTLFLTFKGETLTMKDWAKIKKIPYKCLYKRFRMGWPTEKILTLKSRKI